MRTHRLGVVVAVLLAVAPVAGCASTVTGDASFATRSATGPSTEPSSGPSTGPSPGRSADSPTGRSAEPSTGPGDASVTPGTEPSGSPDNSDNPGSSVDEPLACINAAVDIRKVLDLFDGLTKKDPMSKWKRVAGQLDDIRGTLNNIGAQLPARSKVRANLADIQEELRKTAATLRAGAYDITTLMADVDEFRRICSKL